MDLKGLYYTSPFLAALLTLSLLTLGGIPPTVGFFAKFYLFKVAFQAGYLSLVIVGLLATIFSAYYYLKIVGKMMEKEEPFQLNLFEDSMPEGIRSETIEWVKNPGALIGVFLFGLLLLFSVMPSLLLSVLGKI